MYYNRNLITAAKHEVTSSDGSGIFDLQSQAVFKSQSTWPVPTSDDIVYEISNNGGSFILRSIGTVNYTVDWGDGNSETGTSNALGHTYAASGTYLIKVKSNSGVYRPYFNNVSADVDQITSVAIGSEADLGTNLTNAWYGADNISSFASSFNATNQTQNFTQSWRNLSNLASFPLIDTSSGTTFIASWFSCTNLANFPANMFDTTSTLVSSAFYIAWFNCALTAQSVENILVSLDSNGASNISLGINGGTNAAKTTWSTAANTAYTNLINKGWTISYNA